MVNAHSLWANGTYLGTERVAEPHIRALFQTEDEEPAPPKRIGELLSPGQRVLVQVLRDPVRGKGATLTGILSLAGHMMVWMPALRRTGISRRITDAEAKLLADRLGTLRAYVLGQGSGGFHSDPTLGIFRSSFLPSLNFSDRDISSMVRVGRSIITKVL